MKRLGQAGEMTSEPATYPGYRFLAEIISHAVWLTWGSSLSTAHLGPPSPSDPWLEPVLFSCGASAA